MTRKEEIIDLVLDVLAGEDFDEMEGTEDELLDALLSITELSRDRLSKSSSITNDVCPGN